jgi:2-deoxy-D-gluconate 3-dehydrogenase
MIKQVIITGGSKGIGLAMVNAFEIAGYDVISISRTEGVNLLEVRPDIDCDILINNAVTQFNAMAEVYPSGNYDEDMEWVKIALELSQKAYLGMRARGWGRIINISSVAAVCGGRYVMGYAVAKAAMNRMTKCLAVEWAKDGITVNSIMPGMTDTTLLSKLTVDPAHTKEVLGRIPAGRFARPEEIAALALFLAGDNAAYINGACIPIDGGWLAR